MINDGETILQFCHELQSESGIVLRDVWNGRNTNEIGKEDPVDDAENLVYISAREDP